MKPYRITRDLKYFKQETVYKVAHYSLRALEWLGELPIHYLERGETDPNIVACGALLKQGETLLTSGTLRANPASMSQVPCASCKVLADKALDARMNPLDGPEVVVKHLSTLGLMSFRDPVGRHRNTFMKGMDPICGAEDGMCFDYMGSVTCQECLEQAPVMALPEYVPEAPPEPEPPRQEREDEGESADPYVYSNQALF